MTARNFGKGQPDPSPVWCTTPPVDAAGLPFYVTHARARDPVAAWLLADEATGVLLHWLGDRSFPCLGDNCSVDHAESPRLWYGYLPAVVAGVKVPTLLGVTVEANRHLAELRERHAGLRGLKVRLSKKGSRKNGRVLVEVLDANKATSLPAAFDPTPYLLRMWGLGAHQGVTERVTGGGEVVTVGDPVNRVLAQIAARNGHTEGGR
jgi:hypothetical protein